MAPTREEVLDKLRWMNDVMGPVLDDALAAMRRWA